MANLSPEQKALNKDASTRRSRAYKARHEAYRKARESAEAQLAASAVGVAHAAAVTAFLAAHDARQAALADVQRQINELEEQKKVLREQLDAVVDAAAAKRRLVESGYNEQERALRAAVDAEFADMVGVWSAGTWKSLEDFREPAPRAPLTLHQRG